MELLQGMVRPYAWGSRTAIAELLGQPVPAPHPQAELWLGAHPSGSSVLLAQDGSQTALVDAVLTAPERHLGVAQQRWGGRLPFLVKVLAAEEPLSLQAHPTAEQAAEGFAREEAAATSRNASDRNYVDPHHKPELICALTEFHALAGFRPVKHTVELLTALAAPEFDTYRDLLAAQPDADGLRTLFTTWITLPQPVLDALLAGLSDACVELVRSGGPFASEGQLLLQLAEAHPGDAGVLAAALLNYIRLSPGQALYLAPGTLHTYLQGTGIEIMANSDNVLRGGLTAKHVDVVELLRVLDFDDGEVAALAGQPAGRHRTVYRTPAAEFELARLEWRDNDATPVRLSSGGSPEVLLCTAGVAQLRSDDGRAMQLRQGSAAWLAATDSPVTVCPEGAPVELFQARTASAAWVT